MLRRWLAAPCALLPFVAAASCGGRDDAPPSTPSDAAATLNACGGPSPLAFDGRTAAPGDPCGPCRDGALVCATMNELACAGARPAATCATADAAPPDAGGPPNACGGTVPLTFQGAAASPGDACGPCRDGALVCAAPNALACVGALPAKTCADASPPPLDATVVDAPPDVTVVDAPPDVAAPDAPPYDTGPGWEPADAALEVGTLTDGGTTDVRCLALPTQDLVLDPARKVLYASVSATSPELGNSVVRIDPVSLAVTGTVFVGSNPNALAVTDDGSALYLGEDGAFAVRRVELASGAVDAPVYLGSTNVSGPRTAGEIRAVPGSKTRFVVSRRQPYSPSFAGLVLFDGAATVGEWNGFVGGESIAFTSPTVLYGYNNDDSGYDLYRFAVDDSGIHQGSDTPALITGFGVEITSQGGWIFATDGRAVDGATAQPVGTYPASGPVWPDTNGADVWFFDVSTPALVDFDRGSFLLKQRYPLPAAAVAPGAPKALVGWAPRTFAFRTPEGVCVVTLGP